MRDELVTCVVEKSGTDLLSKQCVSELTGK